jgi:hypothetical protein
VPTRSPDKLSDGDLDRLLSIEAAWRASLERRFAHWRHYSERLLCICLAQGGARHLIDGETKLKDFDVYRVFAASPERPRPDPAIYRGNTHEDFGVSHFGSRSDADFRDLQRRYAKIRHRNVDIYSLAVDAKPGDDVVPALRRLLQAPPTRKLALVAKKPFVIIEERPPRVAWPVELADAELRGYDRATSRLVQQ